jgi:hypothetical protein
MTAACPEWPDANVLLAGVAAGLPPIGLEQLEDGSRLMTRVDRKYLVTASTMTRLAAELGDRFAVLRIGGLRQFRYTSTYFDTPDLLTFRQHRQGRRRRFKVRTRTYLDGGGHWLEVKLSGASGATDKHRIPYGDAHALTPEAMDFLAGTLRDGLGLPPPARLEPVLATDYRRVTLVDTREPARITCDTGLAWRDGRGLVAARRDRILLESKSAGGAALADRILRELGVRPVSVSKYCLGVAALWQVPANRWHPVLRRCLPSSHVGSRCVGQGR